MSSAEPHDTGLTAPQAQVRPGYAWYVTGLLGGLYVIAFIDRLVLALLVDPVRQEFGVSDTQMSLLVGAAFAIFYSFVGLPLGRWADVGNRKRILLIGICVWSGATCLSAWATSFAGLAALRIGVAIGEAVLTPCAISLISDIFTRERRASATSFYVLCGTFGAFGAYLFGGLIVSAVAAMASLEWSFLGIEQPWRLVMLMVGIPGLLMAVVVAVTVREPPRSRPAGQAPRNDWRAVFRYLRGEGRFFWAIFVSSSLGQMLLLGSTTWTPTFLVRSHDWSIGSAGIALGITGMAASLVGLLAIPRLVNRWTLCGSRAALPRMIAIIVGGAALFIFVATLMSSGGAFLSWLGAAIVLLV